MHHPDLVAQIVERFDALMARKGPIPPKIVERGSAGLADLLGRVDDREILLFIVSGNDMDFMRSIDMLISACERALLASLRKSQSN